MTSWWRRLRIAVLSRQIASLEASIEREIERLGEMDDETWAQQVRHWIEGDRWRLRVMQERLAELKRGDA